MTKKNIITEDTRTKDLFRTIHADKPADDFTLRIMQRITAENLVIEKKAKPFNIVMYAGIAVLVLALFIIFLPALTQWTDYFTNITFPTYTQRVKEILNQILVSAKSIYISPVVIIICSSCSVLFTLLIMTNAGQMLKEKK